MNEYPIINSKTRQKLAACQVTMHGDYEGYFEPETGAWK